MAVVTVPAGILAALIASAALAAKKFLASKPTETRADFLRKCNGVKCTCAK